MFVDMIGTGGRGGLIPAGWHFTAYAADLPQGLPCRRSPYRPLPPWPRRMTPAG